MTAAIENEDRGDNKNPCPIVNTQWIFIISQGMEKRELGVEAWIVNV
jgi:hypothetical protein